MFAAVLMIIDLVIILMAAWFMISSFLEHERRAPKVGLAGLLFGLVVGAVIIWLPAFRPLISGLFAVMILGFLMCLIPKKPSPRVLQGASGWTVDRVGRIDERDIVFARNRSIPPEGDAYRAFYDRHPEWEEPDARRRERGGPLGIPPGRIDNGYRSNVSLIISSFQLPSFLGPHAEAEPDPGGAPSDIDPKKASHIVKAWARHLGADLVGICRVDPAWAYSHRGEIHFGNWDEWGDPLADPLPYAVVICTEMDHKSIAAGPHTPCTVESGANYAKGAYITTILARWFAMMGYRAMADHSRHYQTLMVPLAVNAGLGELGRLGYLIVPRYGARVRVFACLTDMPLIPDKPVSLGVEEFCRACKKCAETCPSKSIPLGEKTVHNGVEKWKINPETCFDFWSKVGTDCSICMGICPFSRPNTPLHNLVRWFVAHAYAGKFVFPHIDNWIYGKKWRPRPVPAWLDYPKGSAADKEVYGIDEVQTLG